MHVAWRLLLPAFNLHASNSSEALASFFYKKLRYSFVSIFEHTKLGHILTLLYMHIMYSSLSPRLACASVYVHVSVIRSDQHKSGAARVAQRGAAKRNSR